MKLTQLIFTSLNCGTNRLRGWEHITCIGLICNSNNVATDNKVKKSFKILSLQLHNLSYQIKPPNTFHPSLTENILTRGQYHLIRQNSI